MRQKSIAKQLTIFLLIATMYCPIFAGRPKFSDQQIIAMAPSYFKRMRNAPEFLGAEIYRHPQQGKTFQVNIRVDRNNETEGLGLAFDAMLTLSQYFKKPPKVFVAVLHSTSRGTPPVICRGDANCTADHYIHKRISYKEWYNRCITFEGT